MKIAILHSRSHYPVNYIRAVRALGASPVCVSSFRHLKRLAEVDCGIFCGGCDGLACLCGATPKDPSPYRDGVELAAWGMLKEKPVLGICRGMQFLCCLEGGKLYNLDDPAHQGPSGDVWHPITPCQGTFMATLYPAGKQVNSSHHQAVETLPEGLSPAACCGAVLEAAQGEGLLLVQFHPERMSREGLRIFQLLKHIRKK